MEHIKFLMPVDISFIFISILFLFYAILILGCWNDIFDFFFFFLFWQGALAVEIP